MNAGQPKSTNAKFSHFKIAVIMIILVGNQILNKGDFSCLTGQPPKIVNLEHRLFFFGGGGGEGDARNISIFIQTCSCTCMGP